jgi:hypothetical protein
VVAGVSGSGKTTFALRYLIAERDFTCRFIFDAEGEFEERLGLTAAEHFSECAIACEDGFVVFDPHAIFPGQLERAFDAFCAWSFDAASRLPGRKVILLDEAWKYCDRLSIPASLATCVQTGRKRGLETLFSTQLPHKLNGAILNELTELVCFTLGEAKGLDCVAERGAPREEIESLALGSFVALNKHTRGVLRGKVF